MALSWAEHLTLPTITAATMTPLCAFLLIMVCTRSRKRLSAILSITAATISVVGSTLLIVSHQHLQEPIQYSVRWLSSGALNIPFGFLIDQISLLMITVVAVISFLVQIYSLGYMADDPGFTRYFGLMSLFLWAMMCLAVSPTMFQLYIFWELVGLSSYLLIGFWYEKLVVSQAGKKALVMTRAGDIAMFVGILLVFMHLGNLNIVEMDSSDLSLHMPAGMLTLAAVLILGGIVGKSAQFPLLTWLPDAMQGPSPVSALLHSSTMVAAGIYLFGRLFPFFVASPVATTIGLSIGTISMLLSSTMAMVSRDIKQIWAYSTISQLGFMLMGLDAGSFFSGTFHMTTHAAFKSLLFLCAGVLIHKFESNDIYELSAKGSRGLKVPMACSVIAAGALAGLPPLSGFFSKEAILASLAGLTNPLWLGAALLGIFMTGYYASRPMFILLFPRTSTESHRSVVPNAAASRIGNHHRTPYRLMSAPLLVLAFTTLTLGFLQGPLRSFLDAQYPLLIMPAEPHFAWLPWLASILAVGGVGLAWIEFGRKRAEQVGFVDRMPVLARFFAERWYLDHLYQLLLDRVVDRGLSRLFAENDNHVIDGGIDHMADGIVTSGRLTALFHAGMVQYRLLMIFVVLALLLLYFFFNP